jgi:hypothetical protein
MGNIYQNQNIHVSWGGSTDCDPDISGNAMIGMQSYTLPADLDKYLEDLRARLTLGIGNV